MDQDKANRYTQIVSVVAVLIGLAFVAYELKQSNAMMRAQIRNELAVLTIDINRSWQRPELIALYLKASAGVEVLSAEEERLLYLNLNATFRMWENMHYQNRIGMYDESEISTNRQIWSSLLEENKFYRDYWIESGASFSEEFRNEINSVIDN